MVSRRRRRGSNPLLTEAGFTAFYERHADPLLGFFARRVYDAHLALELTAETFSQAFMARRRFRGTSDEEAAAWLQTIARRQLARYYRRGRVERKAIERLGVELPALTGAEQARIEELAGLSEARATVREALMQLSAEQRLALLLRVVDELPYPEVARRLGVSEPAARARVSRGLRALGAVLDRDPRLMQALT